MAEPQRIATFGTAEVAGTFGVELGNVLTPFLLEKLVQRHYLLYYDRFGSLPEFFGHQSVRF